jgi:hypothetical protein
MLLFFSLRRGWFDFSVAKKILGYPENYFSDERIALKTQVGKGKKKKAIPVTGREGP